MKRLPMRKIREALRLRADGFSGRQVAQSLAVGRATISEYFRRADVEGLRWPLPADLSDAELERRDVVARTQVVLVIGCSTSDLDT